MMAVVIKTSKRKQSGIGYTGNRKTMTVVSIDELKQALHMSLTNPPKTRSPVNSNASQ